MRIAVILAALMIAAPALAQTQSRLQRLGSSAETLGWTAIGRVDIGTKGFCTGTLIASDLVLTAAHCLFDNQTKAERPAQEITFLAGYRDGHSDAVRRVARTIYDPRYEHTGKPTRTSVASDIALLQLAEPIPSAIADPFAVHSGAASDGELSVFSYGRGRSDAMSWQRNCNLLNQSGEIIVFDCSVTYGSSGSAVFMRENGRFRVFSVVSAVGQLGGKPAGFGMKLGSKVRTLEAKLRATPLRQTADLKRLKVGNSAAGTRSAGGAKFLRVGD